MVKFTEKGIMLEREEKPLYSATFHYWRSSVENWDPILKKIKGMHFEMVETYIPWSMHEEQEGVFDFGTIRPERNLDLFLSFCEDNELYVIVRPGPHINAEMTNFGYPEWILYDEEIMAKNPFGTTVVYPYVSGAFPIPSYASPKLYQKTKTYFNAIAPILKKHVFPNGCVIAIQADNETCNFFRDKPYIMDYSTHSISDYNRFLKKKYGTVEEFLPPSGYQEGKLAKSLDWIAFKEEQILDALAKIVGILKELDLQIPIFHNCAYQTYSPISIQRIERIEGLDVAGIDAYPEVGDTIMLKERMRYMAGSSRLPYIPEFGSGSWFDRLKLLSAREEEFSYLYAFMYGLKAVGYYMIVERDRWTGCPIRFDGMIREDYYQMFQKLNHQLINNKIFLYERKPKILLLKNYDMGRKKAAIEEVSNNTYQSNFFIKGPAFPENITQNSDPKTGIMDEEENYFEETYIKKAGKKLDELKIDFNMSDCYLEWDKLIQYDCVIASLYDNENQEYLDLLKRYGQLPGKQLKTGNLVEGDQPDHWGKETFALFITKECRISNPFVEYIIHKNENNNSYLLYVANISDVAQQVMIEFHLLSQCSAIINGTIEEVETQQLCISLEEKQVAIYHVQEVQL